LAKEQQDPKQPHFSKRTTYLTNWGPCKQCKWWQIEPDAEIEDETKGVCTCLRFQGYRLRVAGDCGCARFTAGEPIRAAGSGESPPTTFVAPAHDQHD